MTPTLQKEIKFVDRCDTAVNHCSWTRITVPIRVLGFSRVESSMMSFATNHDSEFRGVRLLRCVKFPESCLDLGHFFSDDCQKLTLKYTVGKSF